MENVEFTRGQIHPVECVREAFELIKQDYWLLFAVSIVGALIGGFSMYVLIGAMVCGIFYTYLRVIDGGRASFDDLWVGFKFFVPSLLATLIFVIPIVVYFLAVFFTLYLPIVIKIVGGNKIGESEILTGFAGALVIDVVIAIAMVCIHSLMIFTFPLIVDKRISSLQAVKLSARAAMKNIAGIGGLIAVSFGLVFVGYAAFCIGLYFIIPILTATNAVAYRKVFPRSSSPSYQC